MAFRIPPTDRARAFAGLATLLAAAAVAAPGPAAAQSRADLLVSADWLANHLDDPDLVLLHVGPEEDYAAEHIPGARHVTLNDISAPEDHEAGVGLSLQMPAPRSVADAFEGLGIGDDSRVVVYVAGQWGTAATRVILTLDWIGLGDRTSLLDGGMRAWVDAGHALTDAAPEAARRGELTPRVREGLVVTAEWVRDRLDDDAYRIIDARAPVHYDGIQPTYLHREPVRKGHIPGAANVPFNVLWNDDNTLKAPAELAAIFREAGLRDDQTVVGYCHLGQYATAMLFAARTLGYDVKLYDGSFQEWGSREEFPVDGPEGD